MATSGERWASGSYGPLRAIRLPSLMVGGAKSKSSHFPAGAVDVFKVSCFLRGSMAPYPKRLKQGTLRRPLGSHSAVVVQESYGCG